MESLYGMEYSYHSVVYEGFESSVKLSAEWDELHITSSFHCTPVTPPSPPPSLNSSLSGPLARRGSAEQPNKSIVYHRRKQNVRHQPESACITTMRTYAHSLFHFFPSSTNPCCAARPCIYHTYIHLIPTDGAYSILSIVMYYGVYSKYFYFLYEKGTAYSFRTCTVFFLYTVSAVQQVQCDTTRYSTE